VSAVCLKIASALPHTSGGAVIPTKYKLFFECLQPHDRNGDDVTILGGGDGPMIVLNINDLGKGDGGRKQEEEIVVPFLPVLFNPSITFNINLYRDAFLQGH
jgi:hypothetical protein